MPKRMRIPRGDPDGRRGVWKGAQSESQPRTAILSCPACSRRASLSNHDIDPNGLVSPSFVCPHDCAFHEYLHLEEWP